VQPSFQLSEVTEHRIASRNIAQVFRVKVQLPIRRTDETERFPVLYATDADEFFGALATIATHLQIHGEVPRFILVGIGYADEAASRLLRMRDLHTHANRALYQDDIEQLARSSLVNANCDLRLITQTTDAGEFLEFVKSELVPFVDGTYPTESSANSYYGYSAGASFGLFTLLSQPETFKNYILGSPVTSHRGHQFATAFVKRFLDSGRSLNARVYISVGELEELGPMERFDLVSGCSTLLKYLRGANIRSLQLITRMFPGETHASAWMPAFSHGLRVVLGPADDIPFCPIYLRRASE
jgi:predicted alpha/beta superfamily hydrolase